VLPPKTQQDVGRTVLLVLFSKERLRTIRPEVAMVLLLKTWRMCVVMSIASTESLLHYVLYAMRILSVKKNMIRSMVSSIAPRHGVNVGGRLRSHNGERSTES